MNDVKRDEETKERGKDKIIRQDKTRFDKIKQEREERFEFGLFDILPPKSSIFLF